jgi:hypothetical protein
MLAASLKVMMITLNWVKIGPRVTRRAKMPFPKTLNLKRLAVNTNLMHATERVTSCYVFTQ